jgi:nitrogen fixation NifU-like protein
MDPLYREYILDHYKNPRNFGDLPEPDAQFEDRNPLCGDEMGVQIKLAGDRIDEIRFHGHGCAISQATASIISDELRARPSPRSPAWTATSCRRRSASSSPLRGSSAAYFH